MKIKAILRSILEIRKHEWQRVILTCIYFFLTIASYYILKTVRNAYFVHRLGADVLPWVKIAIVLFTGIFVFVYSKIAHKTVLRNLINGTLLFLVVNLVLFWWAFNVQAAWLPFAFFMWVTLFSSITVTQFWTLTNDLFDSWEAKRVLGVVGTGGLLGGMSGSYISSHFAAIISTRNLLLVAAGIIVLCIVIVSYLWKHELAKKTLKNGIDLNQKELEKESEDPRGPFSLIRSSRYLLYLMLLVGFTKFATELTEWQLNKMAEIHVTTGMDDLTAFFGTIFGHLNAVALVIQVFVTSFFLRKFGGASTLLLLPGGLLIGSGLLFFFPAVWSVTVLKIIDGSLRYSIFQSAKEFVYLPIERHVRYKIKPFIDMFIYQFAKGLAAFFIILVNMVVFVKFESLFPGEESKVLMVSVVVFVALFLWFIVVALLRKEYPVAVREYLVKQSHGEDAYQDGEIAKKLNVLRMQQDPSLLDPATLKRYIDAEIKEYRDAIRTIRGDSDSAVVYAKLQESVLRIFNYLGFLYSRKDMIQICHYYLTGDEYVRAHALEMLDLTIERTLRRKLIHIFDGKYAFVNYQQEKKD